MRLKPIGVSLLLFLVATQVSAEAEGYRRDGRDTVRSFFLQHAAVDRSEQRNEPQRFPEQRLPDRQRSRESGLPESSGYSGSGEYNSSSNSALDNARRTGRLTPEERRALRRQIDEAGHDIYAPKR